MTYDKEAYKNFYEKNKDMISEKHTCQICFGSYTYYHKSKHNKTKKHLIGLLRKYELEQDTENYNKIKELLYKKVIGNQLF